MSGRENFDPGDSSTNVVVPSR